MPTWVMLQSTNLSAALYEVGDHGGSLSIAFHSGRSYSYRGVPYSVYLGLLSASSSGQFFNQHIRGRYPFVVIGTGMPTPTSEK